MSERTIAHRVPALLDELARDGHVPDRQALESFVLARPGETKLPLAGHVLVGVGVAITWICLNSFLEQSGLIDFDDPAGMLIAGPVFMVVAIGLKRMRLATHTIAESFQVQASLATLATGKFLIIFGVDQFFTSDWAVSLAALIVTAATYHVFAMSLDRFLSSLVVLLSILANILWGNEPAIASILWGEAETPASEPLFIGFVGLQLACAGLLLTHGRARREYAPLAYAFVLSLCATALYLTVDDEAQFMLVNACLAGGLIALFAWVGGGLRSLKRPSKILASLGAVLLGVVSAPAVMLSVGLIVIGYAKHERALLVLGALLMPEFLIHYYYSLDVSLLGKSLILTGSGLVLLAGHVCLSYTVRKRREA